MLAALNGAIIVGGSLVVALAAMLLVRRNVRLATLEEHREIAGFLYATIGVMYAVLLASAVVAVWEQFEDARQVAESEANALEDLHRLARALPEAPRREIQELAVDYSRAVVDEEWDLMARGGSSARAWDTYYRIRSVYNQYEPQSSHQTAVYQESLSRLTAFGDNRRLRLLAARTGMPGVMWVVLVLGGVITIGYSYFFGVKNVYSQALLTAVLTTSIALVIFVISALDYPFAGNARVDPDAFESMLERSQQFIGQ